MTSLVVAIAFGVAAALGTVLRWRASVTFGPAGTLLVNIAGAFALGLMAGTSGAVAAIVGTAGLGALTTVSGIAPEMVRLAQAGPLVPIGYLALTIAAATVAAATGLALA